MVVRKFNYYRFFVFIVILVSIIVFSIKMISDYNYKKTDEYKLLNVGYNEEEIKVIKDKLSDDKIESLLNIIKILFYLLRKSILYIKIFLNI